MRRAAQKGTLRKRGEQADTGTAAEGSGVCRKDNHLSSAGHQQAVAVTAWGSGQTAALCLLWLPKGTKSFQDLDIPGCFLVSPAGSSGSSPLSFLQTITGYWWGSGWARQGSETDRQDMIWFRKCRAGVSEDTGAWDCRGEDHPHDRGCLPGAVDQA